METYPRGIFILPLKVNGCNLSLPIYRPPSLRQDVLEYRMWRERKCQGIRTPEKTFPWAPTLDEMGYAMFLPNLGTVITQSRINELFALSDDDGPLPFDISTFPIRQEHYFSEEEKTNTDITFPLQRTVGTNDLPNLLVVSDVDGVLGCPYHRGGEDKMKEKPKARSNLLYKRIDPYSVNAPYVPLPRSSSDGADGLGPLSKVARLTLSENKKLGVGHSAEVYSATIELRIPVWTTLDKPTLVSYDEPLPTGDDKPLPTGDDEPLPMSVDEPLLMGDDEPLPVSDDEPLPTGDDEPLPMGDDEPLPMSIDEPLLMGDDEPLPTGIDKPLPTGIDELLPMTDDEPLPTDDESLPTGDDEPLPTEDNEPLPTNNTFGYRACDILFPKKLKVGAKIPFAEPSSKEFVLNEARMYRDFPQYLSQDHTGFLQLRHKRNVRAVAVVPKSYGYYVAERMDDSEVEYKPILLLEECGVPVAPDVRDLSSHLPIADRLEHSASFFGFFLVSNS